MQVANLGVSGLSQNAAKLAHVMADFAQDIQQLEEDWGETLLESPRVLWDEATIFRKSSFLAGNSNIQVTSMVPKDLEQDASSSSEALSVISKSGHIEHLGHATAVVSIWPSGSFRKALQNKQSLSNQDCSDWTIYCEIWRHGRLSDRIIDIKLPLDPNEIWIQLRQSLRSLWGAMKISFPLVIGDSLLLLHSPPNCLQSARRRAWKGSYNEICFDSHGFFRQCQTLLVSRRQGERVVLHIQFQDQF